MFDLVWPLEFVLEGGDEDIISQSNYHISTV